MDNLKSGIIDRRYKNHFTYGWKRGKTCLNRAMRKHGVHAFDFEIVELCDKNQLFAREKHYIDLYHSASSGGFNTVSNPVCSPRDFKWLPASRQRLSIALTGRTFSKHHIENISVAQKRRFAMSGRPPGMIHGGPLSEAHKTKLRRASAGVGKTPEHNRNVSISLGRRIEKRSMDGVIVSVYHSAGEAARLSGLDVSNICKSANGKYRHTGGFLWTWAPSFTL